MRDVNFGRRSLGPRNRYCRLNESPIQHPGGSFGQDQIRPAVIIAENPLGLPGGKDFERRNSVMTALVAPSGPFRITLAASPVARPPRLSSRTLNESRCLPAASTIRIGRPARTTSGQPATWRYRSYFALISLGDLFVQRRNARRKFAASLNPSASAMSSLASRVVRKYFSAICIRSSSSKPRKEMPCSRS
jgi:hypothetical protein